MKRYLVTINRGTVTVRDRVLGEVRSYIVNNPELEQAIKSKINSLNYNIQYLKQSKVIDKYYRDDITPYTEPEYINISQAHQYKLQKIYKYN